MLKNAIIVCLQTLLIQVAVSQYYVNPGQTMLDNGLMFGNAANNLAGVPFGNGISGGFNGVVGGLSGAVNSGSGGLATAGVNTVAGIGLPNFGSSVSGTVNNFNGISTQFSNSVADLSPRNMYSSGPFLINSYSPIAPTGLTIVSENYIEGALSVSGQLPFLSVVAFEGTLPSAGSGIATCGCGSGNIGIINEGLPNAIPNANYGKFVTSG